MEIKDIEKIKFENETIQRQKFLTFKRNRKENELSKNENINKNIYNIPNNIIDNDNILLKIDKHVKQLSKLKNCERCGKENIKRINDKNEFFNLLNNEFLKKNFNTEDIKKLYDNIIIDSLCEDCIFKEIIIGGINNLLNNINNNSNGIINSISQFFINSFIKRFELINKSMEKISKDTTDSINKRIVHLMLNKKELQLSQFNEDMDKYINLLKNINQDYWNLYESIIDENEILNSTIYILNNSKLNTFTKDKFQKIIEQIKEINNETVSNNNKKIFNITNPFNNINNDLKIDEIKNSLSKSHSIIKK